MSPARNRHGLPRISNRSAPEQGDLCENTDGRLSRELAWAFNEHPQNGVRRAAPFALLAGLYFNETSELPISAAARSFKERTDHSKLPITNETPL